MGPASEGHRKRGVEREPDARQPLVSEEPPIDQRILGLGQRVEVPAVEVTDRLTEQPDVRPEPPRKAGPVEVALLDADLVVLEGQEDLGVGVRVERGLEGDLELACLAPQTSCPLGATSRMSPVALISGFRAEPLRWRPTNSVSPLGVVSGGAPGGAPVAAAAAALRAARSSPPVVSVGCATACRHRCAISRSRRALKSAMARCNESAPAGMLSAGPVGQEPRSSESSRVVSRSSRRWLVFAGC